MLTRPRTATAHLILAAYHASQPHPDFGWALVDRHLTAAHSAFLPRYPITARRIEEVRCLPRAELPDALMTMLPIAISMAPRGLRAIVVSAWVGMRDGLACARLEASGTSVAVKRH